MKIAKFGVLWGLLALSAMAKNICDSRVETPKYKIHILCVDYRTIAPYFPPMLFAERDQLQVLIQLAPGAEAKKAVITVSGQKQTVPFVDSRAAAFYSSVDHSTFDVLVVE